MRPLQTCFSTVAQRRFTASACWVFLSLSRWYRWQRNAQLSASWSRRLLWDFTQCTLSMIRVRSMGSHVAPFALEAGRVARRPEPPFESRGHGILERTRLVAVGSRARPGS